MPDLGFNYRLRLGRAYNPLAGSRILARMRGE